MPSVAAVQLRLNVQFFFRPKVWVYSPPTGRSTRWGRVTRKSPPEPAGAFSCVRNPRSIAVSELFVKVTVMVGEFEVQSTSSETTSTQTLGQSSVVDLAFRL